jgi:hypothetical protein
VRDRRVRARAPAASTVLAALVASAPCACAPSWPPPDAATWPGFEAALAHERDRHPAAPWAATVRFQLFEPSSGQVIEGRGGLAIAPGSALRMILVGGAGSTIVDAWITRERWRVAVPPARLVRRGGSGDHPRDLPVDFLRWWFVAPLSGTLVAAKAAPGGDDWLLRDGDAMVSLRSGLCGKDNLRHLLEAARREQGRKEHVFECRSADVPAAGDRAGYVDQSSGLAVGVVIESVASAPPEADAFRDPDPGAADTLSVGTP